MHLTDGQLRSCGGADGAYDESGAAAKAEAAPPQSSGVLNLDFDAALYQGALSKGVAFTQQLKLAPGRYRLRLGVTDLQSHRLGTLDMSVMVAAENP
jgi:hypothetical protein